MKSIALEQVFVQDNEDDDNEDYDQYTESNAPKEKDQKKSAQDKMKSNNPENSAPDNKLVKDQKGCCCFYHFPETDTTDKTTYKTNEYVPFIEKRYYCCYNEEDEERFSQNKEEKTFCCCCYVNEDDEGKRSSRFCFDREAITFKGRSIKVEQEYCCCGIQQTTTFGLHDLTMMENTQFSLRNPTNIVFLVLIIIGVQLYDGIGIIAIIIFLIGCCGFSILLIRHCCRIGGEIDLTVRNELFGKITLYLGVQKVQQLHVHLTKQFNILNKVKHIAKHTKAETSTNTEGHPFNPDQD